MLNRLLLVLFLARAACAGTTVTLLHFSDYHSHALPFYSEDAPSRGGLARAIGYMKREHARGALVFSGGDTINKGSPAWSDKYGCAEWPWLNGIVDDMALGNHDTDYGFAPFEKCRAEVRYPILSANTNGFQHYDIFTRHGIRIGVFAVAGSDFKSLVKTPELKFADSVAAAREVVRILRDEEHADVVVMIGHEHTADDAALARAIPGIDLILGSHSHEKHELMQLEGSGTWFIAPFQYLTYISRVSLTFEGHRLTHVAGTLVPVDSKMKSDKAIETRVAAMQHELEIDPQYSPLFAPVATLAKPMSVAGLTSFTLEAMADAANADFVFSTNSSFRQPLPDGVVTEEMLRAALPYDNEIVVCTMPGEELLRLEEFIGSRAGTESASTTYAKTSFDRGKTYRVATTDYAANIAYRDALRCERHKTGLRVRETVRTGLAHGGQR